LGNTFGKSIQCMVCTFGISAFYVHCPEKPGNFRIIVQPSFSGTSSPLNINTPKSPTHVGDQIPVDTAEHPR